MLRLRALEIEDLPFLYQWENDAKIWDDGSTHNPLSQTLLREYFASTSGDIYKDGQIRLIAEISSSEGDVQTIGCADLFDFDPHTMKAAIGLYVSSSERGKGYGMQIMKQLEDYAFSFLGLNQLYAFIATDNAACCALFEHVGYKMCGCVKQWVKRLGCRYVDANIYQKLSL